MIRCSMSSDAHEINQRAYAGRVLLTDSQGDPDPAAVARRVAEMTLEEAELIAKRWPALDGPAALTQVEQRLLSGQARIVCSEDS